MDGHRTTQEMANAQKGKKMRKKKLIRRMGAEVRGQPGPPEA